MTADPPFNVTPLSTFMYMLKGVSVPFNVAAVLTYAFVKDVEIAVAPGITWFAKTLLTSLVVVNEAKASFVGAKTVKSPGVDNNPVNVVLPSAVNAPTKLVKFGFATA